MRGFVCLFFMLMCFSVVAPATEHVKYALTGTVRDKDTRQALEYATVYIEELGLGVLTDSTGMFRITGIPSGNYQISIQFLGYTSRNLPFTIDRDIRKDVELERFSLELEGVNVLAEYRPEKGSSVKMKREALKYIQPSSLNDIFQLLPGGLQSDGNLSKSNQVVSRQAGSDQNTAFGMAIVVDGAPLSNNGNLQGISGTDQTISDRSVLNGGVDLRMISTDHLEEAEIIQGISSVKYGDMSSGVVVLRSKRGHTPWEARVKADPLNKLAYIGKGFKLPGRRGTLNAGVDLLQARPDVRERLQQYTRISSQLLYANRVEWGKQSLNYDVSLRYYGTLESKKDDPDVMSKVDTYNSYFNRWVFTGNTSWIPGYSWLNRIDLTFSADYTADILKRKQTVTPTNIVPLPVSKEEGESEGIYLPAEYLSAFRNENRPLNLFGQLSAKSVVKTRGILHSFLYGLEFRLDKNLGAGVIYDLTRPPYPGNSSSSRPRSFRSVPAMIKNAFFAEDRMRYEYEGHLFRLDAGVRLTNLSNLPGNYAMSGKFFAEPRINFSYTMPSFTIGGKESALTLRAGYGKQTKFPSLDYLYPDRAWFDVMAANYYAQNPEDRFLWVVTKVKDRTNPELKPDYTRKAEAGLDWRIGNVFASVTLFNERSENGYAYTKRFFSFPYKKYEMEGAMPVGKPALDDFTSTDEVLLKNYTVPVNSQKVVKKGVEYLVNFPEIRPVRTKIGLRGAYYHTVYDISLPEYYQPASYVNGKPYNYAGVYAGNRDCSYREQMNTSIWLDTHIPMFRLHFTASVQLLWFTTNQTKRYSGVPVAYVGPDGVTRPFTETEMNNPELWQLVQTYTDNFFKKNRKPVSVGLNLKATKELGNHLELSFFVNRLWDYNPVYKNNLQQEIRDWQVPFFGAELTLRL